jgi:hypothetical protein
MKRQKWLFIMMVRGKAVPYGALLKEYVWWLFFRKNFLLTLFKKYILSVLALRVDIAGLVFTPSVFKGLEPAPREKECSF